MNLLTIGVILGFVVYAYFEYKLVRSSDLRKRSGGGGENRPAKKNP